MPAPLQCPTCSAPLDLPETHDTTVRCPYCGSGVLLNERLGTAEAVGGCDTYTAAVAEVVRLLRAGDMNGAVAAYRDRLGVGLHEAVLAVQRIASGQLPGSLPASSPRPSGSRGAVGCALFVVLLAAVSSVLVMRRSAPPASGDRPAATTPSATVPAAEPAREPERPGFERAVLEFGSEGTGAGRFTDARGVAVDGQGRIYVAEYSGGRVQVFDSLGTFLTQWITEHPQMPLVDLAADRGGTVYVVQWGRIWRYEGTTGKSLGVLPRPDRFSSYSEIALALDGSLHAVAGQTRIVHLGPDGEVRRTLDAREVIHQEALPAGLAVAGTGDLYVLDRISAEVYRLDPRGRFVDRFGGEGDRPDQLRSPEDLAIDGRGRVYVSDAGRGIRVFAADGGFVESFGGEEVVFGLAFNDRDELFAAYRNRHQVVKFRLGE